MSIQFDGYMATVPSKHDLASFVRSIHAELALAVPAGTITARQGGGLAPSSEAEAAAGGGAAGSAEADLSLLPILMKGVVQAVRLFCAKVEAMQSVEQVRVRACVRACCASAFVFRAFARMDRPMEKTSVAKCRKPKRSTQQLAPAGPSGGG